MESSQRLAYAALAFLAFFQLLGLIHGQGGLQIEFETGFPLAKDPVPRDSKESRVTTLNDESLEWRLPTSVRPTEYEVTVTPIITENSPLGQLWDVPGSVTIHAKAVVPTNEIVLHSKDIDINMTSIQILEEDSGINLTFTGPAMGNHSFLKFELTTPLDISKTYLIKMDFVAKVKDGLDGLYRSSYIDPESNETKWIATTQMEALHARQLFPCFDEPFFKAKFYFTIGRRNEHIALFNAPSMRNRTMVGVPGYSWEEFQPTPLMSTYLLALIVSEFSYVDARDQDGGSVFGKQVRTYAPKHYIERGGGEYAAEKADLLLKFFEDYYVEKYPLEKMDSAAVPDFFFGAMENYGLNIYRETALLYFPDESTEAERFSITNILAHELAHQWFGNLVTTRWWTHIWLNEGFATYLAAQGVEAPGVGPEFEPRNRFINDAIQNSMGFDARPEYSHSVKIDEEDWITRGAMDWFDRMVYEKAGSLIRMMNGFLTEPVLKQGLLAYLKAMQFNAAVQDDLFFHLNASAKANNKIPTDLSIKDIMDTWTLQPGFPLIRVAAAGPQTVYISQERFINNQASSQLKQDMTGLWHVPLFIATKAEPNRTATDWLYNDEALRSFQINTTEWVVVNNGANGFFRVLYDATLTGLIKEQLIADHTFINSVTRSQLLDDYFNAAWQKYINIETALDLATYLDKEQDIVVWNAVLNNLRRPFNLLSNSGSFYSYLRSFLHPKVKAATILTGGVEANLPEVKGGMPVIRHLQFLDWLCAMEDEDCFNYALKLVNEWKSQPNNNTIRRDIKPVVYCSAVAHGDTEVFNFIKGQYQEIGITAKQRGSLLDALACSKDVPVIQALLEEALHDTYFLSKANGATIMQRLARNPIARPTLVRFFRDRTGDIIAYFGGNATDPNYTRNGVAPIVNAITALSSYVSTTAELEDIQSLLLEHPQIGDPAQGYNGTIDTALNNIQSNIAWVQDFAGDMRSFFETN